MTEFVMLPHPEIMKLAREVVTWMRNAGLHGPDGAAVLGITLGFYMEGEGPNVGYSEFEPVAEIVLKAARLAFSETREARERESGHA